MSHTESKGWEMDATTVAAISASCAVGMLMINVVRDMMNGGWSMSARLTAMEGQIKVIQDTLSKMGDTLAIMADMKTEHALLDQKVTFLMEDISLLRKGQGYIQAPRVRSVDGEYPVPPGEGGR